jgi:membrane protein required for colicin V production
MNSLDIIFLILFGLSIIYSFIRGSVREIFSFLSLILGFFGASYGSLPLANWLKKWTANETVAQILGFTILFILIALAISLLGRLLSRLVKKTDLSWVDRVIGAAFGFVKAALVIAVILLVLTAFLPSKSEIISDSKVAPKVLSITRGLSFLAPEKLQSLYDEKERELKKYWTTLEGVGEKSLSGKRKKE